MSHEGKSAEGLPAAARERLRQLRGPDRIFTSDLSVNEFLLVTQAGFDVLGLVVGSSIYHIGRQVRRWGNRELDVLTQSLYHARELAMTRMEAEADALGADGIVGVRLEVGHHEWKGGLAEFIAIGTAVKHATGALHRAPSGRPFTSDLSGQDFWTLLSAGYRPVGLVLGNCVYHVAHQNVGSWASRVGKNRELPNYTQGIYSARELAMTRMQAEAEAAQAEGIVGVELHEHSHRWGSRLIEFLAIGTAVVPTAAEHEVTPPVLTLNLNDPPTSVT